MKDYDYKLNELQSKEKAIVENFNYITKGIIRLSNKFADDCGEFLLGKLENGVKEKELESDETYIKACYIQRAIDRLYGIREELYSELCSIRNKMAKKGVIGRRLYAVPTERDMWWIKIEGEKDYTKLKKVDFGTLVEVKFDKKGKITRVISKIK